MIFRIGIVLACIVLFINGCNSLISVVAGTHKLRTFTMEEVRTEGVGDADYIEISDTWIGGDYSFAPSRTGRGPGIVQFPVLSPEQHSRMEGGSRVVVDVVAWTKSYDPACLERGDCVMEKSGPLRGIVRKLNKNYNRLAEMPEERYDFSEIDLFMEVDRSPVAWYWHLGTMILAGIFGLGTEIWYQKKEKKA